MFANPYKWVHIVCPSFIHFIIYGLIFKEKGKIIKFRVRDTIFRKILEPTTKSREIGG